MIIVETERLVVRTFEIQDAELLYQYSIEETAQKELPDEVLDSVSNAREKIEYFNKQYESGNILVYAIVRKSDKLLIGHISLSPISEGVEIGYSIATAFQRNGYSTEIVLPFSLWAKEIKNVAELYGVVKASNIPSIKSLERAGYAFVNEAERICWGKPHLMRLYIL